MKPTLKDVKNLNFIMRPSDRGQIIEVSYAQIENYIIRRIHDSSEASDVFAYAYYETTEYFDFANDDQAPPAGWDDLE